MSVLLKKGAIHQVRGKHPPTLLPPICEQGPVALAAASGSAQVVSELVRANVPYRTRDREGRTPLHHAARFGHISVLRVVVAEMRKSKGGGAGGGGGGTGRGGGGSGVGGRGEGEGDDTGAKGDHSLMMDGGPFK